MNVTVQPGRIWCKVPFSRARPWQVSQYPICHFYLGSNL